MVPEKDIEIKKGLRMILKCNPISIVQDTIYRNFTGFKYKTRIGVLNNIIFKMTELVEKIIIVELKTTTCGAIMHDGWSRYGVHYLCYFTYYIFDNNHKSRIISLAPMANKEANVNFDTKIEDATHLTRRCIKRISLQS